MEDLTFSFKDFIYILIIFASIIGGWVAVRIQVKTNKDSTELAHNRISKLQGKIEVLEKDHIAYEERSEHIKSDISEIKGTLKEFGKGLNKLTTSVTLIASKMGCKDIPVDD